MGRHWLWNGRPGALGLVKELAAHMDHAGLLIGLSLTKQPIEPGKAIGMDRAGIARKMAGGVLALPIDAELIVSHVVATGSRPMANAQGGATPHHGRSSRT